MLTRHRRYRSESCAARSAVRRPRSASLSNDVAVSVPEERDGRVDRSRARRGGPLEPPPHPPAARQPAPRRGPQQGAAAPPASAKTNSAEPERRCPCQHQADRCPGGLCVRGRRGSACSRRQACASGRAEETPPAQTAHAGRPTRRGAIPAPATDRRGAIRAGPRQGFESEADRVSGPVAPPGGAELLATAAEVVSEIAKAGIATGERLLRDVLSRLASLLTAPRVYTAGHAELPRPSSWRTGDPMRTDIGPLGRIGPPGP